MTRDFCKGKAFYDLNLNYEQSYELGLLHGAAAEREACAKVCDEIAQRDETGYGIAEDCASAIRAMGSKE